MLWVTCHGLRKPLLSNIFAIRHFNSTHFRTSSRNNVNPLAAAAVRVVTKSASVLFGRLFGRWWRKLNPKQQDYYKAKYLYNPRIWAVPVGVITIGGGLFYYTHLETTPITNRRRYIGYSSKHMKLLGELELKSTEKSWSGNIIDQKHPVYNKVKKVVQRIVENNDDVKELNRHDWKIQIIKEDSICNAFVLPTGHIFVFTGLLKALSSDDQLAFILAHELSHVILNHGAEKLSFMGILDTLAVFSLFALWAIVPVDLVAAAVHKFYDEIIKIVLTLPYGRKLESEADRVGLILISKACYDVRESSVVWRKFSILEELEDREIPEILSTHPDSIKRAAELEDLIPEALNIRRTCNCPELKKFVADADIAVLEEALQIKRRNKN